MTFGNKRKKRLQNDAKIFVSNIFSSEKYCLPNFDWVKKNGTLKGQGANNDKIYQE